MGEPDGDFPSSASQSIDDFPPSPFLSHCENNLALTGFQFAFPLFMDEEVRDILGYQGQPFLRNVRIRSYFDASTNEQVGVVQFPLDAEGPIGCVHGGCSAATLDNILGGQAMRSVGMGCVTLQLNISYRNFVPLGSCVRFRSWTDRVEGRKVFLKATLSTLDGETVLVESDALFFRTNPKALTYDQAIVSYGRLSGMTKEDLIQKLRRRRKKAKL